MTDIIERLRTSGEAPRPLGASGIADAQGLTSAPLPPELQALLKEARERLDWDSQAQDLCARIDAALKGGGEDADETGWSRRTCAAQAKMLDAIHAHYAAEIERLRGREEALMEGGEIIIELKKEVERLKAKVFDLDEALAACSIISRRARKARIAFVEAKNE